MGKEGTPPQSCAVMAFVCNPWDGVSGWLLKLPGRLQHVRVLVGCRCVRMGVYVCWACVCARVCRSCLSEL